MNGAFVDGVILSSTEGWTILSVRSHHPTDTVSIVKVNNQQVRGVWCASPGTRAAFAGRLNSHGGLHLEATTAWIEGEEVTTYSNDREA